MIRRAPIVLLGAAVLASALLCSPSRAQWVPGGVLLCAPPCKGDEPSICPDGAGGAFVTWRDYRSGGADAYLQHVTAAGAIAPGWAAGGLPICTADGDQFPLSIIPDGFGGAIVAWMDFRYPATGPDIFAQRINADGTIAPGWPVDGAPVVIAPDYQDRPTAAGDGTGGAFFVWTDCRPSRPLYAQHLTASGNPAEGWPPGGLLISAGDGVREASGIVADGSGGALIGWWDTRSGSGIIYAQRVTAGGAIASGWPASGLPVMPRLTRAIISDGAGGAYFAGAVFSPGHLGFDAYYWVQRITSAGAIAPGWPATGMQICAAPNFRTGLRLGSDGLGGALVSWEDYRAPSYFEAIYVMRVLPDATLAPGWTPDGVRLTWQPFFEVYSGIAADGLGGAYFSWTLKADTGEHVQVQHLTATAAVAPGWPVGGHTASLNLSQHYPRITTDGAGGAIVTWDDASPQAIYAQRFVVDGPVAALLSLVSAEAATDGVTLAWQEGGDRLTATLYRRAAAGEWIVLARLDPDGEGFLRYEDRDVTAGTRYGYRLGIVEGGVEKLMGEVSVEVPLAAAFALKGVSPNPAVRDVNVAFSLTGNSPAKLELIDIAGRRVKSEEVGALGAGSHVVNLGRDAPVAAGVYLVRLTQEARSLTARAVVVR